MEAVHDASVEPIIILVLIREGHIEISPKKPRAGTSVTLILQVREESYLREVVLWSIDSGEPPVLVSCRGVASAVMWCSPMYGWDRVYDRAAKPGKSRP